MTQSFDFQWELWVEWPAPVEWTTREVAVRLMTSVRLAAETFPGLIDGFQVGTAGRVWRVESAGVVDRVAGALTGRRVALEGEPFVEGGVHLFVAGGPRLAFHLFQLGSGGAYAGRLRLQFFGPPGAGEFLTRNPATVARLVAELGGAWTARNAWVDMSHVRNDWNRWDEGYPVYGWATWLHPGFATVDPAGLDVDATHTADGGVLIALRVDPGEMADWHRTVGKDIIEELIRRTVLADGRRLVDVNPNLHR